MTYDETEAWEDNYHEMAARWAECDNERLRLKAELADARMRLRILSEAPAGGNAHHTPIHPAPGVSEREVPAAPPAGQSANHNGSSDVEPNKAKGHPPCAATLIDPCACGWDEEEHEFADHSPEISAYAKDDYGPTGASEDSHNRPDGAA